MQEKFFTIRSRLCGVQSYGAHVDDAVVTLLKEMFSQLQIPFETLIRSQNLRHSLLNYNFIFRRFFDLLGVSHYGRDFPPLKGRKKREEITSFWLSVISFLKWPYLNNDEQLFGAEYAVDIGKLQRRAAKQQQQRASQHVANSFATSPCGEPCDTHTDRGDCR